MIVLTRKKGESINIGADVEIVVIEVRGEKVRLGINAPASVPVYRREVYDQIKRQSVDGGAEPCQPPQ